ncbi:MAG: bifunctional 3'-5' exonuclease/DNA polymerase [Deltaproteobacteria bacterium]|nr:bifunctional 3'-5' exonuclease/DNA polymerase [Deltaproteobacteria bacterium]
MNIMELLLQDDIKATKQSNTNGGEYASACPWCGGKDRFRIWPGQGRWWCRQCQKTGDAITYLKDFRQMSYPEACRFLGREPGSRGSLGKLPELKESPSWSPAPPKTPPPTIWQDRAGALVKNTSQALWSDQGVVMRKWLEKRGLKPETLRALQLGFNPQDLYLPRPDWGLPEIVDENTSKKKSLWIPQGLVIPYFNGDKVQRLRVRREGQINGQKYILVPGSSPSPLILGRGEAMVIVESELDGMLIYQEAGDLVQVMALGSAQLRPNAEVVKMLRKARLILVSLDNDEAGAESMWGWWLQHFPQVKCWPVLVGKDPSEAYQMGMDIRPWVIAGIPFLVERFRPKAPHQNSLQGVAKDSPTPKIHHFPVPVTPGLVMPSVKFRLVQDAEALKEAVESLVNCPVLGLDTETTGLDPFTSRIRLMQLAGDGLPVVIVDTKRVPEDDLEPLRRLLTGNAIKVFHNAKFDLKFLERAGLQVVGPFFDTMLAEQILMAGRTGMEFKLKDLTKRHLGLELPKELQTSDWAGDLTLAQLAYAARDARVLLDLRAKLRPQLIKAELVETARLEFACLPAVVDMELNGMKLDEDAFAVLGEELIREQQVLESLLRDTLGDINMNSPDQLLRALYRKGMTLTNTNRETLAQFSGAYPMLATLRSYRQVAKLVQSFVNKLPGHIHSATGRIHPDYRQIGAATGRFSCRHPNLQQIPRGHGFRDCLVPEPGKKLVVADYSQIELRVVAEITGDERMLQAYHNGQDLHRLTASLVMGKDLGQVTKEERQRAKALNFGIIFAMGAESLQQSAQSRYGVNLSPDQAQTFRKKFFQAYKGINCWHQDVKADSPRETRTINGRRRIWDSHPKITELYNTPVQGAAADITKKALALLVGKLNGSPIKIIGAVHDEILLEAPSDQALAAEEILKQTMIEGGSYFLKKVPVEVETGVLENWSGK